MKILVSGFLIRKPVAGLAWHYGQYLIGLKKLGHDVLYIEDSESMSGDLNYNLEYARKIFNKWDLSDSWTFFDFHHDKWIGPGTTKIKEALERSDILLNVSGSLALPEWFEKIPIRVFIDTDPVFTQSKNINLPSWTYRSSLHTHFMTFGENIFDEECDIPMDYFPWKPTRQPIITDIWSKGDDPSDRFTTIMSWKSYKTVKSQNNILGVKAESFNLIEDLPPQTSTELEIALDAENHISEKLKDKGWFIRSAEEVSKDPYVYKSYIENSIGELTIAKDAYVKTNTGWFSERSACYLAAGRPVVTEETGFSKWMDVGTGVIAFTSGDEALDGLTKIIQNYKQHSIVAKEIAYEYFDYIKVLRSLLDYVTSTDCINNDQIINTNKNLQKFRSIKKTIESLLPEQESFILIDDRQLGVFGYLGDLKIIPFIEKNGQYWGAPSDSEHAIRELNRLIKDKVQFLVLSAYSNWWMEKYPEFSEYIQKNYKLITNDQDIKIFQYIRNYS